MRRLMEIRRRSASMEADWYELEAETVAGLQGRALLAAAAVAMVYVGLVAAVAGLTGAFYIMFPELGALAYDVFGRPRGHWSNAPIHLASTPVITGVIGILITRSLPYGFLSVLLNVGGALAVILALGSPIAPAISAGLLPLVLGVKSWGYPPGIMFGTVLLAAASLAWRRLMLGKRYGSARDSAQPSSPTTPRGLFWVVAYFAFLIAAVAMVRISGLRFILFPPLAVIGFEMFGHTESCAWAGQPFRLPIVCLLTAAGGLAFHHLLGVTWMTAALSMAWGMTVLQLLRVHVPPALAVALLPMVMDAPTWWYPCSVGLGTLALTLWFWCCRDRLLRGQKNHARAAA
jgi:HPP family